MGLDISWTGPQINGWGSRHLVNPINAPCWFAHAARA